MRTLILAILLLVLRACAPEMTDPQIATAASRPFDKAKKMGAHEVLGRRNKTQIVADYYCSDVCPAYTVRIVHFAAQPGPSCANAGGVEKRYIVPVGIAAAPQVFCVPKVLAERNL